MNKVKASVFRRWPVTAPYRGEQTTRFTGGYDYIGIDNMVYMPYNGLVSGKILNFQMFQISFYETEKGKRPAEEFLLSLNPKMRAKMTGLIGILGEKGNELRMPYSEYLGDGIFELRCIQGSDITRVLYFFYVGRTIILTGGFVKKQQKTPKSELRLAKLRMKDFLKRYGDNNEDI